MKDSRFIELLNLYVDQQLSPAEAAELEREISTNAERRKTYQQYCRMQKACCRLFDAERAQAPASITLAKSLSEADRKIVAFPTARPATWQRTLYVAGLVGAAACVTFVVVSRRSVAPDFSNSASTVATSSVPDRSVKAFSTPVVVPVATREKTALSLPQPQLYTVLPARSNRLSLPANTAEAAETTNLGADRTSFDWMSRVNLQPINRVSTENLAFESRPVAPSQNDTRVFGGRRTQLDNTVETIGFQFTR